MRVEICCSSDYYFFFINDVDYSLYLALPLEVSKVCLSKRMNRTGGGRGSKEVGGIEEKSRNELHPITLSSPNCQSQDSFNWPKSELFNGPTTILSGSRECALSPMKHVLGLGFDSGPSCFLCIFSGLD